MSNDKIKIWSAAIQAASYCKDAENELKQNLDAFDGFFNLYYKDIQNDENIQACKESLKELREMICIICSRIENIESYALTVRDWNTGGYHPNY